MLKIFKRVVLESNFKNLDVHNPITGAFIVPGFWIAAMILFIRPAFIDID